MIDCLSRELDLLEIKNNIDAYTTRYRIDKNTKL